MVVSREVLLEVWFFCEEFVEALLEIGEVASFGIDVGVWVGESGWSDHLLYHRFAHF